MSGSAPRLRAGVIGSPVRHSLSPLIHGLWIKSAGIDAEYVLVEAAPDGFARRIDELRGVMRGFNVTLPFKEEALAIADTRNRRAEWAGAANLLVFDPDGGVTADNTDGLGLLAAFAEQAPRFYPANAPIVLLGAGGAARGAAAALLDANVPEVRLVNRTRERAEAMAEALGGPIRVFEWDQLDRACADAGALVNATSLGLEGKPPLAINLAALPPTAVVMDMVYKPLRTALLRQAQESGRPTVDGLAMLIGQAGPSFEALFGVPVPEGVDVRHAALAALGETE